MYKTNIIESTQADNDTLDTDGVVPLKYLSNFWRSLGLLIIICEIELDLSWSRHCIISKISITAAVAVDLPNPTRLATWAASATFQINCAKKYVPVVTLSINNNIKVLENMKKTVFWNKYRSETTRQLRNNNLDYMIDTTYLLINCLFFCLFAQKC